MENCIFCKIIKCEIPSKKVYEDNDTLAFLDINPANTGHTIVVPKKHFENIYKIDEDVLESLIKTVKKVATTIKENLKADGINIIQNNGRQAGQIVNHVHFHIIPRFKGDKVIITYQPQKVQEKDLNDVLEKLKESASAPPSSDFDSDW